ncbi:hypothetical protein RvY_00920 [Ramazzottius varieornatus]|uniref:Metalloendopeptidase n=1 Tax=Ramazzottius varieornatus TaxID=947166 RepID=A0A1D1UIH1_RAMVA|nr:hypothetical protein RvY_00920 [Ramazzottius varieornatus]
MFNCVRFAPFNAVTDSREDHIVISPTLNSGITSTCSSFPGRVISQNARGQKLIIFGGGPGGCMLTKRDVMAIIIPVLGLRQEYRRPDRDTHIQVFPNNIRSEFRSLDLLKKYDSTMVEFTSPFDFFSITMPSQSRFVNENSLLYVPRKEGQKIGEFARLSQGDCQGLKKIYPTCARVVCSNPYNITLPEDDAELDPLSLGVATFIEKNATVTRRPRFTRRPTTTRDPELPANNLFADEGTPLDPPFNGLEFWLDPNRQKTN